MSLDNWNELLVGSNTPQEKEVTSQELTGAWADLWKLTSLVNSKKIDVSKDWPWKELAKRFLTELSKIWAWDKNILDDTDIGTWDFLRRLALSKIANLVRATHIYWEWKEQAIWFSQDDLDMLNNFMNNEIKAKYVAIVARTVLSEELSKPLPKTKKKEVVELSQWTEFNSISVNSASYALLHWFEKDWKPNQKLVDLVQLVKDNYDKFTWFNVESSILPTREDLVKVFKDKGVDYIFWVSKYPRNELTDLRNFLIKFLWDDFNSLAENKPLSQDSLKKVFLLQESWTVIQNDRFVETFDKNKLSSLLDYIADVWWNDQGSKADWVLRWQNSKSYDWFLSRVFTQWEHANAEALTELQIRNTLSKINDIPVLKNLIKNVVWVKDDQINEAFADDKKLQALLSQFIKIALSNANLLRNPEAILFTREKVAELTVEKATQRQTILDSAKWKLETTPAYKKIFDSLTGNWASPTQAQDLLDDWIVAYFTNIEAYLWVNISHMTQETINRIVDSAWNILSETKTSKTNTKLWPTLVLWFDIATFQKVLWDDWKLKMNWWIHQNGILWVNWVALPLTSNVWVDYTIKDNNLALQSWELKWNIVIWASVWAWIDLWTKNTSRIARLNINWNDKIDSIEVNVHSMKTLFKKLLWNDWKFDATKIDAFWSALDEMEKKFGQNPNSSEILQIQILKAGFDIFQKAIAKIEWENINADKKAELKNLVLSAWIDASVKEYQVDLAKDNNWIHISWVSIWMFASNLWSLWINLQHISWAYKWSITEKLDKLSAEENAKIAEKNIIPGPEWKTITLPEWTDLNWIVGGGWKPLTWDAIKVNWNQLTSGNKIYYKVLSTYTDNFGVLHITEMKVSNNESDIRSKQDNSKIETEKTKELISLSTIEWLRNAWAEVNDENIGWLKKFMYKWVREWVDKWLTQLIDKVEAFLRNPDNNDNKTNLISAINDKVKNYFTVKNDISENNLIAVASILAKLTWGDSHMKRDWNKVSFNDKQVKEQERVLAVETADLGKMSWSSQQIAQEIAKAKTEKLKAWWNYERHNLSEKLDASKSWSTSLVLATPFNWKHRLIPIPSADTQYYWDLSSIDRPETKKFMLEQVKDLLERRLKSINETLKLSWSDIITTQEYKDYLLTWNVGDKMKWLWITWTKTDFYSFAAWFNENECFNVWATILYGKLSRKTWGVTTIENFTDITWTWDMWNSETHFDKATVWIAFSNESSTDTQTNTIQDNGWWDTTWSWWSNTNAWKGWWSDFSW